MKNALFTLLTLGLSLNVFASEPKKTPEPLFKDGKGYYSYIKPLDIPLPEQGKVLIRYFYHYGCEACISADDNIKLFVKQNADKVIFERSPAFPENKTFTARMNATFALYGRPELSDRYLFDSSNNSKDHSLLDNNQKIFNWLLKNGVDVIRFNQIAQSEEVKKKVMQDFAIYQQHSPSLIPMATLDGKYVLVKNTLYNDDYTYAVLDFLVAKRQQERKEEKE